MDDVHLLYQMGYDEILYFIYDPVENVFYNQYGVVILNIFEYITPNNLFLFKQDFGYCLFTHKNNHRIWCEILLKEE